MEACSDAKERKLDLFLHSPGGDPDTVEQMCAYLRTQFDEIRAIVPVYAMSAATMIALAADEIVMGADSGHRAVQGPKQPVRMWRAAVQAKATSSDCLSIGVLRARTSAYVGERSDEVRPTLSSSSWAR
jgi:membrane-bound ClpP family serine protease